MVDSTKLDVSFVALALVLTAACSSPPQPEPAKPSEDSPTRSSSAATAGAAHGSAADPWTAQTPDPAADLALLHADVDIICGAAKVTGGKTFIEVGPYIAETMKTTYKVGLFADHRTMTLDDFLERIRKLMARVNVAHCETLDVLIANDPRKKPRE